MKIESKKILILIGILATIVTPWIFKYYSNKKNPNIKENSPQEDKNCSKEHIEVVLKILLKYDKSLNSIKKLTDEEKEKIYQNILENYIIIPRIISSYIKKIDLNARTEYEKEKKAYLEIMENNFTINTLQNHLLKEISITDKEAEEYYEKNKKREFYFPPFTESFPKISVKIIKTEDKNKTVEDYKKDMKDSKKYTYLDNFHQSPLYFDEEIKRAVLSLNNEEYKEISKQDGNTYLIYKVEEKKNIWKPYSKNNSKIKSHIKNKMVEKKIADIIEEGQKDNSAVICAENILTFIKEKISFDKKK